MASVLRIEIDELKNAIQHLERSNRELRTLLEFDPDPEYRQAIGENIVTMAKKRARVAALEEELRRITGEAPAEEPEAVEPEAVPVEDGPEEHAVQSRPAQQGPGPQAQAETMDVDAAGGEPAGAGAGTGSEAAAAGAVAAGQGTGQGSGLAARAVAANCSETTEPSTYTRNTMATLKRPFANLDSPTPNKLRGFSKSMSLESFEDLHGPLPHSFPLTLSQLNQGPHAAPGVPELPIAVGEAFLRMLSAPVTQFQHVMNPENRAKSRYYMFLAQLLAEIRHGTLLLCAADSEELEELEEHTLADAMQLDPGFEEELEGDVEEEGPMELVMLRAPEGGSGVRARNRALSHGLQAGMQAGCEAALLVEVKALVGSHHMWQALSAGIALARRNAACGTSGGGNGGDGSGGGGSSSGGGGSSSGGGRYPGSPVHVVLTDTRDWHFMGIQATAAAATEQPAGGAGGVAAAAAAGSSASGASGGLDYTLKSGESFRLFNCCSVYAPVLVQRTEAARMVEVMYRLYTALYPDEDLGRLPDLLDRGDIQAKEAAQEWLVQRTEKLERARPPADYAGLVARVAELEAAVQALRERGSPGAAEAGAGGGGST